MQFPQYWHWQKRETLTKIFSRLSQSFPLPVNQSERGRSLRISFPTSDHFNCIPHGYSFRHFEASQSPCFPKHFDPDYSLHFPLGFHQSACGNLYIYIFFIFFISDNPFGQQKTVVCTLQVRKEAMKLHAVHWITLTVVFFQ